MSLMHDTAQIQKDSKYKRQVLIQIFIWKNSQHRVCLRFIHSDHLEFEVTEQAGPDELAETVANEVDDKPAKPRYLSRYVSAHPDFK